MTNTLNQQKLDFYLNAFRHYAEMGNVESIYNHMLTIITNDGVTDSFINEVNSIIDNAKSSSSTVGQNDRGYLVKPEEFTQTVKDFVFELFKNYMKENKETNVRETTMQYFNSGYFTSDDVAAVNTIIEENRIEDIK